VRSHLGKRSRWQSGGTGSHQPAQHDIASRRIRCEKGVLVHGFDSPASDWSARGECAGPFHKPIGPKYLLCDAKVQMNTPAERRAVRLERVLKFGGVFYFFRCAFHIPYGAKI
jgi:hypothetical protein